MSDAVERLGMGESESGLVESHGYEPTAAEYVDEGECAYPTCDNDADYRVEVERHTTFLCCQDCSRKHRIYAKENELLDVEVVA